VILTPHASSISGGAADRQSDIFLDNLGRWLRGAELSGVVA
jgi:phosphoglycerate dehydrogenase-like enzyme